MPANNFNIHGLTGEEMFGGDTPDITLALN